MQAPEMVHNDYDGTVVQRIGNADREFAPHGVFPCATDGELEESPYVAIAITTDDQWVALCREIQRPDLLHDHELQSANGRLQRAAELNQALSAWTTTLPRKEVEMRLQTIGVPAHISANSKDFCTDPQLEHRGHLVQVVHPLHNSVTVEGPRYLLSKTPGWVDFAAPLLGQHNEYVFSEILNYDQEMIRRLSSSSVEATTSLAPR